MSTNTQIEWADKTWSPVVGCTQISPGCAHCYALVMHNRRHKAYLAGKLQSIPQYAKPFSDVQLLDDRLAEPLTWRKPTRVFVNSQSDLFHEDIPDWFIDRLFSTMAIARWHTFLTLTKRPMRMREYIANAFERVIELAGLEVMELTDPLDRRSDDLRATFDDETWPLPNVWLGVSVENQRWADERIPLLLETPAMYRFLSCEPLLGPLDIMQWLAPAMRVSRAPADLPPSERNELTREDVTALNQIGRAAMGQYSGAAFVDWVITGAESGHGARPMQQEWVRSLRDQCVDAGVTFMYKQDATPNGRKISLPVLDGRQWSEMPEVAHR